MVVVWLVRFGRVCDPRAHLCLSFSLPLSLEILLTTAVHPAAVPNCVQSSNVPELRSTIGGSLEGDFVLKLLYVPSIRRRRDQSAND